MEDSESNGTGGRLVAVADVLPLVMGVGGLALLFSIGTGVSLRWSLLAGWVCLAAIAITTVRVADPVAKTALLHRLRVAVVAGSLATLAYDGTRWLLWLVTPLSVWPFEAFRFFGESITGASSDTAGALISGTAFHITNGIGFACVYMGLIPRPGLWTGVAWALLLEAAMVISYPSWLDISDFRGFLTISVLGHIAYGSVLGLVGHRLLDVDRAPSPLVRSAKLVH